LGDLSHVLSMNIILIDGFIGEGGGQNLGMISGLSIVPADQFGLALT
jgi:hypothetical protein